MRIPRNVKIELVMELLELLGCTQRWVVINGRLTAHGMVADALIILVLDRVFLEIVQVLLA